MTEFEAKQNLIFRSYRTDMKNFESDVKSLGGIWASDDVYYAQMRDWYYADYRPAYPDTSADDMTIGGSSVEEKYTLIARLSDDWVTRSFSSFNEVSDEIQKDFAKEKGMMEEIAEVSPGVIELCTFPDDDKDYCKTFRVPKDWLLDVLERLDSLNENKGVDLENFLNNYVWDETYFIHEQAVYDGKLINEEENK